MTATAHDTAERGDRGVQPRRCRGGLAILADDVECVDRPGADERRAPTTGTRASCEMISAWSEAWESVDGRDRRPRRSSIRRAPAGRGRSEARRSRERRAGRDDRVLAVPVPGRSGSPSAHVRGPRERRCGRDVGCPRPCQSTKQRSARPTRPRPTRWAGRRSASTRTRSGSTNPVHHDREAAEAAGFRNVVAPPMFCVVYSAPAARPGRPRPGGRDQPRARWSTAARSSSGASRSARATRSRPRRRCTEIYEKDGKGFYVFESVSTNQDGAEVVRGTWTDIVRGV